MRVVVVVVVVGCGGDLMELLRVELCWIGLSLEFGSWKPVNPAQEQLGELPAIRTYAEGIAQNGAD
jgi:hypothetical protein